jgi:hypothetical protein
MMDGAYNIIVLDPNDMQLQLTAPGGGSLTFNFPPAPGTYTWNIPWEVKNDSSGGTGQWFKMALTSPVVDAPSPVTSATIIILPPIGMPGSSNGIAILTELFDTPLPATLQTVPMSIALTYDDYWGLATIPQKTVSATVDVTFVPPVINNALAVKQINISPSRNLPKETTDFFEVAVVLKNFSGSTFDPEIELNFLDSTTSRNVMIPVTPQTITGMMGGDEITVTFSGVELKDNALLEAGKNYWVKAEVTIGTGGSSAVNDEKREMLSVIAAPPEAVPETSLLLLAIIPIAVIIVAWKHRQ